jgi:hypothetical protein
MSYGYYHRNIMVMFPVNIYVGYHTRKITLPVISLMVPVTLLIPVMSFLRGKLPVQVLQAQDHHTGKRTLPVLLQNTTYNTRKVSFFMTLSVLIHHYGWRDCWG